MKAQIFSSDHITVDRLINEWLERNPDIEIFKILQSESGGKISVNGYVKQGILTISIFYAEVK